MKRCLIILTVIIAAFVMSCSNSTPEVNRSIYTVTFLNGDEEYSSSEVYYGDTVTKPETDPEKTGYTFRWWNLNGTKYDFSSAVRKNLTLQAVWKDNSKAEVRIIEEEGKETVYYIDKGSTLTTPSEISRNGYEFNGWKLNDGNTYEAGKDIGKVTEDITLTAAWNPCTYTVEFKNKDESESEIVTYTNLRWGEIITPPSSDNVAVPEGKVIYWWFDYSDDSYVTNITADGVPFSVKSNLVLKPEFNTKDLTVTFDYETGTETATVAYDGVTNAKIIFRSGYELDYWHLKDESTAFDFSTKITEDITLYAKWKPIADDNKLTVTLISDEHIKFNDTVTLKKGDKFNMLYNGVYTLRDKDGDEYRITSWNDSDGNVVVDQAMIQKTFTTDTTLYAVWKKQQYTVRFNFKGGEYTDNEGTHDSIDNKTVDVGDKVSDPGITLTRDGYRFKGWSINGSTLYDFTTPVTGNIELNALWEVPECTLTIKYCDGITPDTVSSYPGDTQFGNIDIKDPVRSGYEFTGWYYSKDGTDTVNSSDYIGPDGRTVYAQWIPTESYTVEYRDTSGETLIYTETVEAGKKAVGYTAPEIKGMTFIGWFRNTDGDLSFSGNSYDFSSPVEENLTLMAGYTVDESYLTGTWIYSIYSFSFADDKTVTFSIIGDKYKVSSGTWSYKDGKLIISLSDSASRELAGITDISSIPSYSYVLSTRYVNLKYHYDNGLISFQNYNLYASESDSSSITCTGGHDNWSETLTVKPDSFLDVRKCAYNGVTVAELKVEGTSDSVKADLEFSLLIPYSADTLVIPGLFGDYYQDVILTKVK